MARKFLARMVMAVAATTAASLLPVAAASAAPNAPAAAAPRAASVHPAAKSANARPDGGTITAGTSIGTAWPPLQEAGLPHRDHPHRQHHRQRHRLPGVISGTPTRAGSYTVMVTITDSARPARNTVIVPIKITIT